MFPLVVTLLAILSDVIDLSDLNFLPAIYTVLMQVFLPVAIVVVFFLFLVILVPPLRKWVGKFFGAG